MAHQSHLIPVYILGSEENVNIITDFTNCLDDLKAIAKGSESPYSTHQGNGLYTVQRSNVREYVDTYFDSLSEVTNIAAEFIRSRIGYLEYHTTFLIFAYATARQSSPEMTEGVLSHLVDTRGRIDECTSILRSMVGRSSRCAAQRDLDELALVKEHNSAVGVRCALSIPEEVVKFSDFLVENSDTL